MQYLSDSTHHGSISAIGELHHLATKSVRTLFSLGAVLHERVTKKMPVAQTRSGSFRAERAKQRFAPAKRVAVRALNLQPAHSANDGARFGQLAELRRISRHAVVSGGMIRLLELQ